MIGNSSDMVRVPTPGITLINVPSDTPMMHQRRLFQASAVDRPEHDVAQTVPSFLLPARRRPEGLTQADFEDQGRADGEPPGQ